MDKQVKEPLIHITKRKMIPKKQEWAIRLGGILAALIFCAIITTITTHLNPIAVYAKMFEGSFGTERKMWALLKELASLLLISVALAPAFKMKFWNLGGGGQVMAGVLATTTVMITLSARCLTEPSYFSRASQLFSQERSGLSSRPSAGRSGTPTRHCSP